ncbi:hypothetical protein OK074_0201 [Actinobacteria bacterium OK074]|nr:hypothetical protein OK074_0201 [Actinobacteria bacterium OK074]
MPAVFVHGVPDTYHVWDDLFGNLTYVDWIIARLEEIGSPVDLVGHDWGSALTVRVASLRPDPVRTWAGGDAAINPALKWSALSKIWQTPGAGEQRTAELDPSEFSEVALKANGMPARRADETASRLDATMKDSLLRLVRSGIRTGAEWEPGLANATSPSLVFWGQDDRYQPVECADSLAKSVRATNVVLLDSGHWPQLQQSRELAAALARHWDSVRA